MHGMTRMVRGAVVGALMATSTVAPCQETGTERAALARALRGQHAALAVAVDAATATGRPISAKYEYENGTLQLSVYTEKAGRFSEVILDPQTGQVAKTSAITDDDDLRAARAQSASVAKARWSLATGISRALSANRGYRAVSVTATLRGGQPVAEITLVKGTVFRTITEPLR